MPISWTIHWVSQKALYVLAYGLWEYHVCQKQGELAVKLSSPSREVLDLAVQWQNLLLSQ